jgi:hypothetical protein
MVAGGRQACWTIVAFFGAFSFLGAATESRVSMGALGQQAPGRNHTWSPRLAVPVIPWRLVALYATIEAF